MQGKTFSMQLAGRTLTVETGKYAEQAGGSALVRCGDAAVLVCATVAKAPRDGVDFLPLSVEFEEKMYSVGKIPGGFIKREGRPSERAILASRLIDRPLRPLFPKGFYNDIQVIATVLSVEPDVQPEILAMIGSSIALSISDAPFMGPTGAVSVGYVDGEYIINPNSAEREKSRLSLTVAGTRDAVMMVEAGANELTEAEMLKAILLAHETIKQIVSFIESIAAEIGKPKMEVNIYQPDPEFVALVREYAMDKVEWSLDTFDRKEREARSAEVKAEVTEHFAENFPDSAKDVDAILYNITKEIVRDKIINRGIRPDGRKQEEIRPIWSEVGILPRTHGSAVFTRGQTQVMTIATLGALDEGQTLDGISEDTFKRYMHQYNMPGFSTGSLPSGKFEAFKDMIFDVVEGGHKVLVFSQFVQMLQIIRGWLQLTDIPFCYLDGTSKDRLDQVDRFNNSPEIPIFLISLKAGGTGINLTSADYVIHYDPWWNPAVESQATDRTHRIGQTRQVFSYKLICQNTVEEKILKLQEMKRGVAEAVIPGQDTWKSLTKEDLEMLFEV